MLVLTRRDGERLYIRCEETGEEIIIAVMGEPQRGRVKIAVGAPKRWHIIRHEIDPKRGNGPEQVQS